MESSHRHGEVRAKRNVERQLTAAGAPECNYSQPLRLRPADNIAVREKKNNVLKLVVCCSEYKFDQESEEDTGKKHCHSN